MGNPDPFLRYFTNDNRLILSNRGTNPTWFLENDPAQRLLFRTSLFSPKRLTNNLYLYKYIQIYVLKYTNICN
jgi:hypothetical protein